MVDTFGRPVRLSVTAGQRHDVAMAPELLDGCRVRYVLGDKAYDSDAVIRRFPTRAPRP